MSTPLCTVSIFLHEFTSNLDLKVSYRTWFTSQESGFPYIVQTKFSSCFIVVTSILSQVVPMVLSALIADGVLHRSLKGPFFPFRTKALVESHPVNAWNAGSAERVLKSSSDAHL